MMGPVGVRIGPGGTADAAIVAFVGVGAAATDFKA